MSATVTLGCEKQRVKHRLDDYTVDFALAAQLLDRTVDEVRDLAKMSQASAVYGTPWPFVVTPDGHSVTLLSLLAYRMKRSTRSLSS